MSGGVGDHFRLWLRTGMTGCEFARTLAGRRGRVAIDVHGDAGPRLVERVNEAMWDTTTENVAALMSVPVDDPRLYRQAAFVLRPELAARLIGHGDAR